LEAIRMKLRIRGNSIRLRLSRTEVSEFGKTGFITECLVIGDESNAFGYSLSKTELGSAAVDLKNGNLSVSMPASTAESWVNSDQVGFEFLFNSNTEHPVRVVVEKDFACLKPRGEDESDNFPHPEAGRAC
jgi:hypothetical protein